MAKSVSVGSAEHYFWGEGCEGWHLVKTDALSVIQERMPPATAERRHLHQHARQFFYVSAGELTVEADEEMHRLGPGQGLEIAPGQKHQVFNHGAEDVHFLVVSQPPSHGDRVDA